MVVGKESSTLLQRFLRQSSDKVYAFAGERSGSVLSYSGTVKSDGSDALPLKVDLLNDGLGIVNTSRKEISGRNNHQNNELYYMGKTCKGVLGDGTNRFYQKIEKLPNLIGCEDLLPQLSTQISSPEYYCLSEEVLSNGNHLLYSYDTKGLFEFRRIKE